MTATRRQERELKTKYEKQRNDPALRPVERLRAYVLSQGVTGIKSLGRSFRIIDKNGDHRIDYQEYQDGLRLYGICVDEETERQCFDDIDMDRTGVLNFDEFLIALRPPMSNRRKELIRMAFNKFDRTGDGKIGVNDLKGVFCAKQHPKYMSGEWEEEDVFREWLNSFNGPDNFTGEVSYEDFENYYVGVSASIDTDAYFDLMMRQAWKL